MNPREFQHLASRLAEKGNFPSEFRTAISRSYYAVYNVGVELLKGMGFSPKEGPGGHGDVSDHFNYSGEPAVTRVASQMIDLAARRRHADYKLRRNDVEKKLTAVTLVHQAERMIETLDKTCFGDKREQIIESIRDWKRKIE